MVEILQAAQILIEEVLRASLDHALLRQLIDMLARDPEMQGQFAAAHQCRRNGLAAVALRASGVICVSVMGFASHVRPPHAAKPTPSRRCRTLSAVLVDRSAA